MDDRDAVAAAAATLTYATSRLRAAQEELRVALDRKRQCAEAVENAIVEHKQARAALLAVVQQEAA